MTTADGGRVAARTDSDGFVYAPSMLHAATAAVLRSGYQARAGQDQRPYAVDLSSARVRSALAVLDAVRDTQPLGAVLGYAFERGLHESHPGVELDRYIDDFRRLYPAVANKAGDTGIPADQIAARSVVDGLALLRAWRSGQIPWTDPGLAAATAGQRAAIEAELSALDDTVDAVSDLLLSESVFQVLKGSPAGAAATLDSLARGHRPPEPEVVATPRGGTVLHQRVAVLFGDGAPEPAWAGVPVTPRAAAAPEVDAWLASLLGDPARIAATVTRPGAGAAPVTLAELGLRPVDLLALVQDALATGRQDELDHRIARRAYGSEYPGPVTVDYDDPGPADLSVAAACEVLAAAARLIGHGRPLTATDLLPPTGARPTEAENPVLAGRAAAARQALTAVRDAVAAAGTDPTALRAALDRAARFGLPEALTASDGADVGRALDARIAAAAAAATARAALTAIFGTGLPVIATFRPERPDLLAPALAGEPGLGDDPDATVEGWLAQVARVQPAVDAWRDVQLYGRSLGRNLRRPRIVQLPAGPDGVPWAGLGFPSEAERPRSGLVSLALLGDAPPGADGTWCGLMLSRAWANPPRSSWQFGGKLDNLWLCAFGRTLSNRLPLPSVSCASSRRRIRPVSAVLRPRSRRRSLRRHRPLLDPPARARRQGRAEVHRRAAVRISEAHRQPRPPLLSAPQQAVRRRFRGFGKNHRRSAARPCENPPAGTTTTAERNPVAPARNASPLARRCCRQDAIHGLAATRNQETHR